MRVLILNQYFPPDPAPTGILFGEIADGLRSMGHEVDCVSAGQAYRSGQKRGMRMLRELLALLRILAAGIFHRRAHLVLTGSSPPCLAVIGALVSARHWAPHIHWCMDLYPEIAVALRELGPGKIAASIRWVMKLAYRRARAVVGLDRDMVDILDGYGLETLECRPWVPEAVLATMPDPSRPPRLSQKWTWLYSGNLGRAHDWQTLLAAQAELESRGVDATLIFQGGGPSLAAARERAEQLGLRQVEWRDYVAESDLCASLLRANCLIVSETPEVKGMLWPSKLALLLGLPRSILFAGPRDGAIARLLEGDPRASVLPSGDFGGVANRIARLRETNGVHAPSSVLDVAAHRRKAIAWWCNLVERHMRG